MTSRYYRFTKSGQYELVASSQSEQATSELIVTAETLLTTLEASDSSDGFDEQVFTIEDRTYWRLSATIKSRQGVTGLVIALKRTVELLKQSITTEDAASTEPISDEVVEDEVSSPRLKMEPEASVQAPHIARTPESDPLPDQVQAEEVPAPEPEEVPALEEQDYDEVIDTAMETIAEGAQQLIEAVFKRAGKLAGIAVRDSLSEL